MIDTPYECWYRDKVRDLTAEVERLTDTSARLRAALQEAIVIAMGADLTREAVERLRTLQLNAYREPKPTIAPCDDAEFGMKP